MKVDTTSFNLTCLAVAGMLAVVAHTTGSGFFAYISAVGGVLVGFIVLALWGDVAVGALIVGIGIVVAGAGTSVRRARERFRNGRSIPLAPCPPMRKRRV